VALVSEIGATDQNSFVESVEDATMWLATQPFDTSALEDMDDDVIEAGLIYAALMMAYLPWRGYRLDANQPLCWPRIGIGRIYEMGSDDLAALYDTQSTTIPDAIWQSQVLIWWFVVRRGFVSQTDPVIGIERSEITSVSLAGLVTVSFNPQGSAAAGSSLNKMISSSEFPIYLLLGNYLAKVRTRGARDRTRSVFFPNAMDTVFGDTSYWVVFTG